MVPESGANGRWTPVVDAPTDGTRPWLGPSYWGNRLQDWRRVGDRLECLRGEAGFEVRTVGILTREVVAGPRSGHVRVVTGIAGGADRGGFCGLLIGVGEGALEYRAAALVQRGSGRGGGMLCTFGTDGRVRFREHTSEDDPLAFGELPAETYTGPGGPRRPTTTDRIRLLVDVFPRDDGRFDVECNAYDASNGRLFAGAIRRSVPERRLLGGIALVSSPPSGAVGARWWFRRFETSGEKIAVRTDRTFGPIAGTLYSLAGRVLKLTAQLLPVGETAPRTVRLQRRPVEGSDGWEPVASEPIGPGHTALFRVADWDGRREWEYRIVYRDETGRDWHYTGRVRADPTDRSELTIGLLSCVLATARTLEAATYTPALPEAEFVGRYTPANFYFPHQQLVRNLGSHDPDLVAAVGDQLYEDNPTRVASRTDPGLDYLYKWYLWVWAFRELTRDRPTLVLVDDHDVYHPNIWGERGRRAPVNRQREGGYMGDAAFVDRVQRTQCGHNPDPYDPTPVERGIDVYYTRFRYGRVAFAIVEDRKWKVAPPPEPDYPPQLLGPRQVRFLEEWARSTADVPATVCFTQTTFACAQTTPNGKALVDHDSNGYPKRARDRGIDRLRDARALVLSGDQHLATLIRHGLETHTDGVVQFTGPAGGSLYQRWFEPAEPLPNGTGRPHTGEFTDGFGNEFRMLAVANPVVPFSEYRRHVPPPSQSIADRDLKREGYGIVRVDHANEQFVIECWPWDVEPTDDSKQFPGWPYRLPFDETGGV